MSVTKIEYRKERPGLRYDSEKKVWIGYRVDIVVGGVRDRTGGFSTRKKAQDYIDQLKEKHKFEKRGLKFVEGLVVPRVSELFEKRLHQIKDHREKIRGQRIFNYFTGLLEHDLRVTDVRSSHFQLFVNARLEDGVQERTVNREFTLLSTAFNKAGDLFPQELEEFEPPKMKRAKVPRKTKKNRIITEKEKEAICAYLYAPKGDESQKVYENRVRIGRMFECAWLLGLRFSEVAKLLKSDFKPEEKTLRVVRWKTNDVTMFEYLPSVIVDLLIRAIEDSETDYVFTHRDHTRKTFISSCDRRLSLPAWFTAGQQWMGLPFTVPATLSSPGWCRSRTLQLPHHSPGIVTAPW